MLKTLVIIFIAFFAGFFINNYLHQQKNFLGSNPNDFSSVATDSGNIFIDQNEPVSVSVNPLSDGVEPTNDLSFDALSWHQVEQMIASNQFADAIQLLRAELDKTPVSIDAWLWLAKVYQASNNHREAIITWLHYLRYEMDVQKRDDAKAHLKRYLFKLSSHSAEELEASWLAQQVNTFIQITSDDSELHLMTAGLYVAANDPYQAQYHALMAANDPATQRRAEAILAQLNGSSVDVNDELVLPLTRYGNQFLVTVNIEGNPARLLLDTGASLSGVSTHYLTKYPSIVKATKPIRLNTANGVVDSYLFTVNQLHLGDVVFNQHILARLPLDGTTEFDGLLGVDVLGRFNFVIDQNDAVLRLGKRR